ncbi:hypothetical protein [Sphingobium yanoikuyae]|uniref:hypothetical protein n=1 Tax=Sphingobium yanoikuyae TaxID=13690 RepID=UPI0022DE041D|nr:hypothetical protein [Sphingobium yanoikuyae]WBQ15024.1 hypothetical protein PAE53_13920 [Sphingobium yanoikuyae]
MMGILNKQAFGRLPVPKIDAEPLRVVRIPCPRCGTVNCADHSASALTSRVVTPAFWRGG